MANQTIPAIQIKDSNVGIGTTGPSYKLDVRGAFGTSPGIYISGTTYGMLGVNKEINNASSGVQYYNVGSQKWFTGIYENTDDFGFYSVGTAGFPMVIKYSTGNVGIGTTNPLAQLHVANTIRVGVGFGDAATAIFGDSGTPYWSIGRPASSGNFRISSYALNALEILPTSGFVGIGTTGPVTKLEVYGGHSDTTARLYSTGNGSGSDASLDMWASEPGVTYDGSGIGNNVNGHPYYGRRNAGIAQSYIRFVGGGILLNTGSTTASQTVTVLASGNVGINNTNPSYKLDVTGDARINTGALGVNVAPSATDGRIDASNDIVAFSSSDLRLKENIKPIENALEKVKSLTGVEFDWKPELKHAHGYEGHDTGVIAQEVQEVMPTAIRTNDTGYLAVRYEKLIGLLIEANKELAARVEELESKFK